MNDRLAQFQTPQNEPNPPSIAKLAPVVNTAEGERTILNTIKRNPGAFKRILGAN